jgi:hypothetical protein
MTVEVVEAPAVPVVTDGKRGLATVKVAVAPVELSVIVSMQLAEPHVSVSAADVLVTLDALPRLSPAHPPPLTLNKVLAVKFPAVMSADHRVFVPVGEMFPWHAVVQPPVPGAPVVGEMLRLAVDTVIVVATESVVSVIVEEPAPAPVVMTRVSEVDELFVLLTYVAGLPTVKAVLPFHVRPPVAVQVREIWVPWFAGTVAGEQVKLPEACNS